MKRRKKFKTIAGYLRSMEQDLWHQQAMAKRGGKTAISDDDGYRQIINNMLPQVGMTERVGVTETPLDGVKRLLRLSANSTQTDALNACLRWLSAPKLVSTRFTGVTAVHSDGGPDGMIFGGKSYTQQETEVLEKIQREHRVSLGQAIQLAEARKGGAP